MSTDINKPGPCILSTEIENNLVIPERGSLRV